MKTQTKYPITSMSRLRKEKRRLEDQIQQEKIELFAEVEKYKNSLWPFRAMNRFRKTVDALSENKLVILGAQLAYSALNTAKEKKEANKESAENQEEKKDTKSGVVDFLKDMAKNFLELYVNKEKNKEQKE